MFNIVNVSRQSHNSRRSRRCRGSSRLVVMWRLFSGLGSSFSSISCGTLLFRRHTFPSCSGKTFKGASFSHVSHTACIQPQGGLLLEGVQQSQFSDLKHIPHPPNPSAFVEAMNPSDISTAPVSSFHRLLAGARRYLAFCSTSEKSCCCLEPYKCSANVGGHLT